MKIQINFLNLKKKSNLKNTDQFFEFKKSDSNQHILKFKKKNYNKESSKNVLKEIPIERGNYISITKDNKTY